MTRTNLLRSVVLSGLSLLEPDPSQQSALHGRIEEPRVTESSGLARSRQEPGVWWTHNDSGHTNHIFPMTERGEVLGTPVRIDGAVNVDWEDISTDDQGQLWISDLGNNLNRRRNLKVYIVDEPRPEREGEILRFPESVPVKHVLRVRYPDQEAFPPALLNFDSEAIFVRKGTLYVLTKHRSDAHTRLYKLEDSGGDEEQVLTFLQRFENIGMVTAAALHPDGKRLALLTYTGFWLFETDGETELFLGGPVRFLPATLRIWKQVEGIDWMEDGSLLFSNEQRDLFRVTLDKLTPFQP